MNVPWLSLTLLGVGCVVSLFCSIMFRVVAFRRHILWGLAVLFVPFASIIFLCIHWAESKSYFLGQLVGVALAVVGMVTIPGFNESFWKAYNAEIARRTGKPAPGDPSAQIQEHRQHLESLQATFARDGVELTKQYQELDAQRKSLKPEDTVAITKFNESAAAYQAKNTARKQMQAQIDSIQKELENLLDNRARQAATTAAENKRVVMYGTNHCPAVEMARQYFVKNGVHYEEINIEGNRTAYEEFKRLGGTGVPLILVGDQKFEGFNSQALDVALR